jgi:hypothetical protein
MKKDEPNIRFPLASSYNERFNTGKTSVQSSGLDQRKINCFYDVSRNAATGASKVWLTKRPGCIDAGVTLQCASTDTPYLGMNFNGGTPWVAVVNLSSDIQVCSTAAIATAFSDPGAIPVYFDQAYINSSNTAILQTRGGVGGFATVFSTAIGTWTAISDVDYPSSTAGKMEVMDGIA